MAAGTGKIIALNGTATADDDGICAAQTAKTLTINGSLTSGGAYSAGTNWGQKIKIVSAADESANTFTFSGVFFATNGTGATTDTMQVVGGNATSVTSSLFANAISAIVAGTTTASSITVGTTADAEALPVILGDGSLYQVCYGGTFGGCSLTLQRYQPQLAEWIDVDSAQTASAVINYEIPSGTIVRASASNISTTSQIGIVAEAINKSR